MKGIRSILSICLSMIAFQSFANEFIPYDDNIDYKLICNGGDIALKLQDGEDPEDPNALYTLYIYEKDAIFYFVDKSEEIGPGQCIDYASAMEVMVPYALPKNVSYYAEIDGAVMWMKDLKKKQGGRKFVGPYSGSTLLKKVGTGYELTIGGITHTVDYGDVYYRLGSQFFDHCHLK